MRPPDGADVEPVAATTQQLFVAFARDRDSATLERALRPHLAQAYVLAHRILGNNADADDAVQEALVRLVATCDRYDGAVAFGAWLGQLVRHAAIDFQRGRGARSRRERAIDPRAISDGAPRSGDSARSDAIRRAIADLPERYRAPIELHYLGELSQQQTAVALGLKEDAVAQRLSRARERLRASLRRGGVPLSLLALTDLLRAREVPARATVDDAGELAGDAIAAAATRADARAPLGRGPRPAAVAAAAVALAAIAVWTFAGSADALGSAPASVEPASRIVRSWSFAVPEASGLVPIAGSWRHRERGGIDDGGCMEIESEDFAAHVDLPPMAAMRLSIRIRPLRPITADGKAWLRIYPADADLAVIANVGRIEMTDDARLDAEHFDEKSVFASGDALDWWTNGSRSSLVMYRRVGASGRWTLAAHGRWLIDDLRVERVRPVDLPDVGIWRDAWASVPDAERIGTRELPGLRGLDPLRPVTITFATAAEVGTWGR
ncbi:MAG TPA: sigma-70 family RNA polymerase sigma factor [Planctomycetota bacterium]|nr:sigma-70 family RNA polymerase sigma factor [Planctomycetota bacterium]